MSLQALQNQINRYAAQGLDVGQSELQQAAGTQLDPTEVQFLEQAKDNPSVSPATRKAIQTLLDTMPRSNDIPLTTGERIGRVFKGAAGGATVGGAATWYFGPGVLVGVLGGGIAGAALGFAAKGPAD